MIGIPTDMIDASDAVLIKTDTEFGPELDRFVLLCLPRMIGLCWARWCMTRRFIWMISVFGIIVIAIFLIFERLGC